MWPESSSVNSVNVVKKFTTIPEISNFSQGITFFWRALYICKITFEQINDDDYDDDDDFLALQYCHLANKNKVLTKNFWIRSLYQGGHKVREKNSRSFPGFSRVINLFFHRLSQQKVNVIMTFIKGHSTSTPAI